MMKARTSLWASLAIAASIGLAGCGGSSDNDDTGTVSQPAAEPSTPTTHAPITVPRAAALEVNADGTGTSNIKAGESREAPGGGTLACATADCALKIERDAGDGSFTVTSTGGTVTYTPEAEPEVSGAGATALRGQLLDVADRMDDVRTGVQVSHLPGVVDGSGSPIDSAVAEDAALRKYVGFPGVTGAGADGALGQADDIVSELADPDKFKAGDAPVALQGWKGERWTKDGEVIVRYTDQNVKTMTDGTFASQFGDNDGGSGAKFASSHAVEGTAWSWKHAEADDLPAEGRVESFSDEASFKGSYGGVAGEFSIECGNSDATSCSIRRDKDGEISLLNRDGTAATEFVVTFTADDENSAVQYKVPDSNYLAFGWWRNTSTGGTTIEDFKVLYSGKVELPAVLTALTGKATYNGHAAGNYVEGTEGGEFVADAKVEVDFENATTEASIDGTISNFRDANGDSLGKWEVIVKDPNVTAASDATYSGGADGKQWASGGVNADMSFYGGTSIINAATSELPTGVAGWFNATTRNAPFNNTNIWADDDVAVAGAFAATRHNRLDVAAE